MGCHTWLLVPFKTDKNEIIKLAQEYINKDKYLSKGHRTMYQWAINYKIVEPICELAAIETNCDFEEEWIIYKDVLDYEIEIYNSKNKTNIEKYDNTSIKKAGIKEYCGIPRIGGFPDKIIRSYDEMVDFMEKGFTNEEGTHYNFYFDKDLIENAMKDIKYFFEKYPKAIITFG